MKHGSENDFSTLQGKRKLAESMVQPRRGRGKECPVCGCLTTDLPAHAVRMGDDVHRVMEVMES